MTQSASILNHLILQTTLCFIKPSPSPQVQISHQAVLVLAAINTTSVFEDLAPRFGAKSKFKLNYKTNGTV